MKNYRYKIIQFISFLAIGAGLLWWLYRDIEPQELISAIREDVNYLWIAVMLFIALLSNVSRTIRWQMMIKPIDKEPGFINTFLAITIAYVANLAIPRMGEVSRCAVLSKYEDISFTKLIGTVVAERILDVIMLFVSLLLVVILQFDVLRTLLTPSFSTTSLNSPFQAPIPYIIILLLVATFFLFRKKIKASRVFVKMKGLWIKFKQGLLSFKKVDKKPWFVIHTILIFFFYFLMMYFSFWAFPYTKNLSLLAGLTVFVFGSLGMVAPVQGGIGPWHFMVIAALVGYGIPASQAGIFALVVHAFTNLMIIIFGLFSFLILPLINNNPLKKG